MEGDGSVKKLLEFILNSQFRHTVPDLTIPTCVLTNDLYEKIQKIIIIEIMVKFPLWYKYLDECMSEYMGNHEEYLASLINACITEHECNTHVFDRFLSVCVLLRFYNDEILRLTGMNFCALNTTIFKELYDSVLKETFCDHGEFKRLIEYVREHRFLAWEWNLEDLVSTDHPVNSFEDVPPKIRMELENEIGKHNFEEQTESKEAEMLFKCAFIVRKILSNKTVEFPTFLNESDLLERLDTFRETEKSVDERRLEAAKRYVNLYATCQENSSSDSDSKTKHAINKNGDDEPQESIIQAIITHNHLESSFTKDSNFPIQKDAGEILNRLKEKTQSLIEVVDQFDKQ